MYVTRWALQQLVKCIRPSGPILPSAASRLRHHSSTAAPVTQEKLAPQTTITAPALQLTSDEKKNDWRAECNKSLTEPDFFGVSELFTVEDLFNARLHLGHREGTLNPFMAPYLFGSRLSHLVFDLNKTAVHLRKALNFLAHVAFRDGIVLFVCRSYQHQFMVEELAVSCGEYAHTREWSNGIFTNSTHLFNGVVRLPDVVVLIHCHDQVQEMHRPVIEAAKLLIPTIGVVDSNVDPRIISYPVPANDDSVQSVEYLANLFGKVIISAKERRKALIGEIILR